MTKKFEKAELVTILTQLQSEHSGAGRSEAAQGIGILIQELNSGKRDATEVSVKGRIKIAKFAGVRGPNDLPVEEQEFITDV